MPAVGKRTVKPAYLSDGGYGSVSKAIGLWHHGQTVSRIAPRVGQQKHWKHAKSHGSSRRGGSGSHTNKDHYLSRQYHWLIARHGTEKAAVAVEHTILIITYHIILEETVYQDQGSTISTSRTRQQ